MDAKIYGIYKQGMGKQWKMHLIFRLKDSENVSQGMENEH